MEEPGSEGAAGERDEAAEEHRGVGLLGRILGRHEDESQDQPAGAEGANGDGETAAPGGTAGDARDTAGAYAPVEPDPDAIDLNSASFEELRGLGFSVTQATRVITYRERENGFRSFSELHAIPGMQSEFVRTVESKLRLG